MGQVYSFANSSPDLAESVNIGQPEVLERAVGKLVSLGTTRGSQYRSDDQNTRIWPEHGRVTRVSVQRVPHNLATCTPTEHLGIRTSTTLQYTPTPHPRVSP